jgi:hypothetical protein
MFATCTEAKAAKFVDIKSDSPAYSLNLDSDKDGIACETDGSDAAALVNGGFVQASSVDNTPFIAGGVALIAFALLLGATAIVRKANSVK